MNYAEHCADYRYPHADRWNHSADLRPQFRKCQRLATSSEPCFMQLRMRVTMPSFNHFERE